MSKHTEWCRQKMEMADGCVCVDDGGSAVTHTPGPWWYEQDGVYGPPSSEALRRTLIAEAVSGLGAGFKRAHANACLIAAAPELLEALEALMVSVGCGCCSKGDLGGDMERAAAAIRKAKGEA